MVVKIGKAIMLGMWLLIAVSPLLIEPPYQWALVIAGAVIVLGHLGQWAGISKVLEQYQVKQKHDKLQVLFFGIFAMIEIHQRLKKLESK